MEKEKGIDLLERLKSNSLTEQVIENFRKKLISRLKTCDKKEEEISNLFQFFESIPPTDLYNFLRFFTTKTILDSISSGTLIQNYNSNNLVKPKQKIDIRKIRKIEDYFIDCFLDGTYEYLQISPLKPLGSSYIIGKNSPYKVITTGFNSELINDPTYSLTLEGVSRFKKENKNDVSLFTISTSIRNQKFSNPLYLPYFKTGSGIQICKKGTTNEDFDKSIAEIINNNLKFLKYLRENGLNIGKITIQLSHGMILYKILKEQFGLQNQEVEQIVYNYRNEYGNGFSSNILKDLNIDEKYKFGIDDIKDSKYYIYFKNLINNIDMSLISNIEIDFSRLAGIGHYSGTIFTIFIEGDRGIYTDISDGGSVNWANELLQTKGLKQVVFGTGIELLGKNF
ncbi:hypothetical protein [Candidatus Absconditicoccus praedator]|uniref:hypothetical protein n=1 Tax=Candidatus Absconditicoccus praedator TaxID=2735562 RepID=UPI001E2C69D3|nr:hypothetical protein [Candidatus Absconditicoccus praedator]UFX83126.1 hypothetical protein HLG78_03255 [Candidatus Absconditicoccus praedator]